MLFVYNTPTSSPASDRALRSGLGFRVLDLRFRVWFARFKLQRDGPGLNVRSSAAYTD